jgi:hypothetical protein
MIPMALNKAIRQDDGVTTNYHRVASVQITTNSHNSIVVYSYVDEDARRTIRSETFRPYCRSTTYETGYSPNMTVELAYEFLKTLPDFEGATDI